MHMHTLYETDQRIKEGTRRANHAVKSSIKQQKRNLSEMWGRNILENFRENKMLQGSE